MMQAMPDDLQRARALVLEHGWNATAYQILDPGMRLWFGAESDVVLGYVRHGRTRVVAGAPVGPVERLVAVAAAFELDAARHGERVCWFAVESRFVRLVCAERRYAALLLGAQPMWQPAQLAATLHQRPSLRAQLHRAHNKGVRVVEWERDRAGADGDLRRCVAEWLATRGLPPLHFLVERPALDRMHDRRVFVAEHAGVPIAFLVAAPIPARGGWLVEHLVRGLHAPNGTSELLLDAATRAAAASGRACLTLGLAPLAPHGATAPGAPPPLRVRLMLAWLREHARRFYDFRGLDAFKTKFRPESWEPVHALVTTPRVGLGTLYAIAGAFAGGSPAWLVAKGIVRAVRSELRMLRRA
jgi:phosphatidylglycerol lysyltransferase